MLFLTLNTFSSTGGIQKVCRTMAHTLNCISKDDPKICFNMYALNDDPITNTNYLEQTKFKGFKGNKILFALRAAIKGIKSNTIIISHINLISIALLIRIFNKKSQIIMMAHGTEIWRKIPFWKKIFINRYVIIWAVSNFTKKQLRKIHNFNHERIATLNNCIDPFFKIPSEFNKPLELLNRYKLSCKQPVLLSIARLSKFDRAKGYDQVIMSLPQLLTEFKDLRYLLCGQYDQEEKLRLEQLIKKHQLQKNIDLINFISEEDLTDHYLLADVFVLPSCKEGFGLVFIEAAACGCKIVSGNTDGSTDAMLDGQLGTIVDPKNADQIKKAIAYQLKKTFDHQEAKNIQKICLANFSHHQYTKKVKRLLFQHE